MNIKLESVSSQMKTKGISYSGPITWWTALINA